MHAKPTAARVILLVEDDRADQVLLQRVLAGSAVESVVYLARDGSEALDYFNQRGKFSNPRDAPFPDLVLIDLNMPKLNGDEVVRTLRSDPRYTTLPIVALSTSSDERDIAGFYRAGVNSYVVKPAGIQQLRQAMDTLQRYWFGLVELPPQ